MKNKAFLLLYTLNLDSLYHMQTEPKKCSIQINFKNFFMNLAKKGIENYDKAIVAL
jgi:hypothetical protein